MALCYFSFSCTVLFHKCRYSLPFLNAADHAGLSLSFPAWSAATFCKEPVLGTENKYQGEYLWKKPNYKSHTRRGTP